MKRANLLALATIAVFVGIFANSCQKEPSNLVDEKLNLPAETYGYNQQKVPSYGPHLFNINNDVATLGRVLFYDKILSVNNSVSCASCHKQNLAFSDGLALSQGFAGRRTHRNSMAIINPAREIGYFWDMRESDLKTMVSKPIQNHIEMGFDSISNIVGKLSQMPYYKPLFKKAFGNEQITENGIQEALTQFLTSMASYNTKFDEGMAIGFQNFTSKELHGKTLFTEKLHCNSCHSQPGFSSNWMRSANIGLDEQYADEGMGSGHFKIPSLRNIALTGPYMHDGRFKTLEEVIEHYNSGVKNHPGLNWHMKNIENGNLGGPKQLNLTKQDKEALIAFLHTLTDHKFITDPKFSNPFSY